jgi:Golgi apparatus protein 1
MHGKAMKCLKSLFVKDRLASKQCALLVEEQMRESALVDYRLDPLLVENCIKELESLCSDESNDKKENCLRLKFQQKLIDKYSHPRCFEEVRRIIIEGAADVFVDRELSQICSSDLARYCSQIAPGASQQLRCLLGIKQSKDTQLTEACDEKLASRRQLWQMAHVEESLEGVNDLARLINESEHRGYLFFILFAIFVIIFVLGCMCRPAVFKARIDKRK